MKFSKARDLAKTLMVFCVIMCVVSIVSGRINASFAAVSSIISLICFVVSIAVVALYCKCPYCGKHIYLGLFKIEYCPKCRRNLETGIKKKGKR